MRAANAAVNAAVSMLARSVAKTQTAAGGKWANPALHQQIVAGNPWMASNGRWYLQSLLACCRSKARV